MNNSDNGIAGSPRPSLIAVPSEQVTASLVSSSTPVRDSLSYTTSTQDKMTSQGATATIHHSHPIKIAPPTGKRLRAELLNKLGIVDQRSTGSSLPSSSGGDDATQEQQTIKRASLQQQRNSILGPAATKIIKAPLKGNDGPPNTNNTLFDLNFFGLPLPLFKVGSPTSLTASTSKMDDDSSLSSTRSSVSSATARRRLSFDEEVSIVNIPRREQYSHRMQQHLWHSREDLQASIMRNTVEYAADGWAWQQVREEEDHIATRDGKYVHPVHEEIARLIRQEQGLPDNVPVATPFLKGMTL